MNFMMEYTLSLFMINQDLLTIYIYVINVLAVIG